jgi:ribosomal protein S18 acetylase RimI-like enzyme
VRREHDASPTRVGVDVRPLASSADAEACAQLMCASEPWLTLGRTYEASLALLRDPTREVYVAEDARGLAGFLILCLTGPFVGYIQTVCLAPDRRGAGLGTALVAFAERRIASVSPNVFLCVSSFNSRARALYERLGYEYVGELRDYLVRGHSELLYRKSKGPWSEFHPAPGEADGSGEAR